jgi:nucleotide-binding universal stress UspA family protein
MKGAPVIRKIVVPVDGSAASERILPHVVELFRAADADVRLVHVTGTGSAALKKGREYLEGLRDRAGKILPFIDAALLAGEPAFEIMKYAVIHHADLIALTTRGRSGVRRIVFGSTAIELMHRSQIPLYLARPTWPARPIRKILAALDSSKTSRGTLQIVADLAQGAGASVLLATILPNDEGREVAERRLRRMAGAFSRQGIPVETIVRPGDPSREILSLVPEDGVDLIAMGTHGRRGTDRFFFGSVAESVLVESPVPLILRRKARTLVRQSALKVVKVP